MRLLLVSPGVAPRPRWGTETYALELARSFAARGHDVAVAYPADRGDEARETARELAAIGVRALPLRASAAPDKRLVRSYRNEGVERAFSAAVDDFRPDVVHFLRLLWTLSLRLPLLARAAGVPTLATLTDFGLLCHRGLLSDYALSPCDGRRGPEVCARCIREPGPLDAGPLELLAKRLAVRALAAVGGAGAVVTARDVERRAGAVREAVEALDVLVAPTRSLARTFRAAGLDARRLEHLVYSIDAAPLAVARPRPRGAVRFGFLGQFSAHKGPATLLAATDELERRLPGVDWRVDFYGEPGPSRDGARVVRALRAARSERVRVHAPFGPDELGRVLASLHAVVLPSQWAENAPFTALQARAAGVPCLASDVPGLREIVEPGVHGELFAAGDAGALADAMERLARAGAPRTGVPGLPMGLGEHLDRLERLYAGRTEPLHATPALVG